MGRTTSPRKGSLQYWPRKRARKILPSVNWRPVSKATSDSDKNLLGFIVYKVGMKTAYVKDNTPHSMTINKRITIPVTIFSVPHMKILSVRFYKNNKVVGEVLSAKLPKELKKKIKVPKQVAKKFEDFKDEDYDDLRVIVYSIVKETGIKKTPDIIELALGGDKEAKLKFVKENLDKEIFVSDVFKDLELVDIRGVTRGRGFQGPTKRFGLKLKDHKSEKGRRGPGSIGPWHPARVTFRAPMAGQTGFFTRVQYNNKIIKIGNIRDKNINPKAGFKHFGKIKTDFIIITGSVQGPSKRQLLITPAIRKTKKTDKKNYEFISLR